MNLSREGFFPLKLPMKVIYLISLQNPHKFHIVMFLCYCSSLTCNTTTEAADCLEIPGIRDEVPGIVTCVLKSEGGGEKTKKKSHCGFLCGQQS